MFPFLLSPPLIYISFQSYLDADGDSVGRVPSLTPVGDGLHDVSYVPPPVGEPYKVDNKTFKETNNNIELT